MDGYVLVLTAGSSGMKFCIFQRPESAKWRLEGRGQIEGIGSAPHLKAKDAEDVTLADKMLDTGVSDGRKASDAVAEWLRSQCGGSRVLGVGRRVVHGRPRFANPVIVESEVLAELHRLTPFAPRPQPYNLAAIEATAERLPGVPQVACFDTSFHRGQPEVAKVCAAAARGRQERGAALRLPWTLLRVHRFCPARCQRPRSRTEVIIAHLGSGASLCAVKDGKSVDSTLGVHCPGWALHGNQTRAHRSRRHSCTSFKTWGSRSRKWKRFFTRSPVYSAFQESAMICGTY